MSFYRREFPEVRVIPKQHLLESHCVPWIQRWGFGLCLHGEQGGEETHAAINCLKRRVWGLWSKEQQLRVLMKEHMAIVSPLFHGLMPSSHNVTVCFISVTRDASYLSVCIIVFIFVFILNAWVPFTAAVKKTSDLCREKQQHRYRKYCKSASCLWLVANYCQYYTSCDVSLRKRRSMSSVWNAWSACVLVNGLLFVEWMRPASSVR